MWNASKSFSKASKRLFSTSSINIDKILVANRGEIACRVIRTAKKWNIPTVALYSVADGPNALHAQMADEAFLIGDGPAPADSYLRQDEILSICKETGVTAVHPGYGLLSERSDFCNLLSSNDIKFIGPPVAAIEAMGSKSKSKAIMEGAGVPCTPGYYGDENQDVEFLRAKAHEIGYPILIKAVMGGGGKGMRLVWDERDFAEALLSCQNESKNAFGDSKVLLEKYLVKPRHVEVQVVCDDYGNAVHLFERDCSLQRRHQKIIEEAPASDLDPDMRARFGEMGTKAAQAVGYVNAGTVEFLLDTQDPENFYFCEMNTRLQVEHPITELITGVDLVEWQLRIAAGENIPLEQSDIKCNGHAFEARVYAENPARNFLPATGNVWYHDPPAPKNTGLSDSGIRVDTGIQSGQDISVYYDPMISKLIVHDADRKAALKKLIGALKTYKIAGVPTNIEFLIKCAQHPGFQEAGKVNTGFLEDYADDVRMEEHSFVPSTAQALGVFAAMLHLEGRIGVDYNRKGSPWSSLQGSWRAGGPSGRAKRKVVVGEGIEVVCWSNSDGSFEIETMDEKGGKGETYVVSGSMEGTEMTVTLNGRRSFGVSTVIREKGSKIQVRMWPNGSQDSHFWSVDVMNPWYPAASATHVAGAEDFVKAPMPGRISRIMKKAGDPVNQGDTVMVMEAMKMEHAIRAPCDGILKEVRYKVDDIVEDGAILMLVDDSESQEVIAS